MENTQVKKRWRTRAEIEQLLAAFERSGMTQQAFCLQNGLSASTFSNWRRKASSFDGSPGVLRPVRVSGVPVMSGVAVRLADGTEVFFPGGCSCDEIAAVVVTLNRSALC
jgi:transposase-like protein